MNISNKHQTFKSCGKNKYMIRTLGDDHSSITIEISNREAWELIEELLEKVRYSKSLKIDLTFFLNT